MCTRDVISAPADAQRGVKGVHGTSVSSVCEQRRRHQLPRELAKSLLLRLNLTTEYPFYFLTQMILKLIYS